MAPLFTGEEAYAAAAEDVKTARRCVEFIEEQVGDEISSAQRDELIVLICALRYDAHVRAGRLMRR